MSSVHRAAMQRRVSLIVTEQGPDRSTGVGANGNNRKSYSPNTSNVSLEEDESCPRRYAARGAPMEHTHSMWCYNDMNRCSHGYHEPFYKCQTAESSRGEFHEKRVSLDDLDIQSSRPNIEERGSVPMIGSLVYYRHKSDSDILNKAQDTDATETVPLPSEKADPLEELPASHGMDAYTTDNEDALVSDAEDPISPSSPPLDFKKYRHFSYPWICANTTDEFSLINSKINSRIRQNDEKLNRYLQTQRRRSHFNNTHYHIPGLDPDPTPDSSESSEAPTPASCQLQNRSSSTSVLNSTTCSNTGNRSPNTNNRHRRRLTCAMIFTRPKVVEI